MPTVDVARPELRRDARPCRAALEDTALIEGEHFWQLLCVRG